MLTYALVPTLLNTHVLAKHSYFSLQFFDTQHILILDCVMVLASRAILITTLAGTIPITANLGGSTTDAGIDSAAFAWSW